MKILVTGGRGNISWHVVDQCLKHGYDVSVVKKSVGSSVSKLPKRKLPSQTKLFDVDVRDVNQYRSLIYKNRFDVVFDFLCFNEDHAKFAVEHYSKKVNQYFFISSASVYKKPTKQLPIREINLTGSEWDYAKNKLACEAVFLEAFFRTNFPVTVVRPSHTYDTFLPVNLGNGDWTIPDRLLTGKPLVLPDCNAKIWEVMHSSDFASSIIPLIGNTKAIGEIFHITSGDKLRWSDIYTEIANVLGVSDFATKFFPPEKLSNCYPYIAPSLLYDKRWDTFFDNDKRKAISGEFASPAKSLFDGIAEAIALQKEHGVNDLFDNKLSAFMDAVLCS